MSFQSSFTGNQVDTAIGRVTNNEFPTVISSSLDATLGSGMIIQGNDSKYLTSTMVLEPNSKYKVDIVATIFGLSGFIPNVFSSEGQDISNGSLVVTGTRFAFEDFATGSRTGFSVPGDIPFDIAYPEFFGPPPSFPGTGLDLTFVRESERFITMTGTCRTGANPSCRFYYWAGNGSPGEGNCSINEFTVTFTKIEPNTIQAKDIAAPQA